MANDEDVDDRATANTNDTQNSGMQPPQRTPDGNEDMTNNATVEAQQDTEPAELAEPVVVVTNVPTTVVDDESEDEITPVVLLNATATSGITMTRRAQRPPPLDKILTPIDQQDTPFDTDVDEITPPESSFRQPIPGDPRNRTKSPPTTEYMMQRIEAERIVESTEVNFDNVVEMATRHMIRRRVRLYDEYHRALCIASKCIDTKRMCDHMDGIFDRLGPERAGDIATMKPKLMEYRQNLNDAVLQKDYQEVTDIQGAVESMILQYDRTYLERIEAKKLDYKRAVRDNIPPHAVPGWLENPVFRFLSLLRGDFKGDQQKISRGMEQKCMSRSAWILAISAMFVAIGFVTFDFQEARRRPGLSTHSVHHERLQLPVVWACATKPMLPMFETQPNSLYVGKQMWGIRSYSNKETGEQYTHPETEKILSEPKILGPENCMRDMQHLSKRIIDLANSETNNKYARCYSCLRIGVKNPATVDFAKSLNRSLGSVSIEFATLRDIDVCFSGYYNMDTRLLGFIKEELLLHASLLEERGALVMLNPAELGIDFALKYGFEVWEALPDDWRIQETRATVFCNLYLFAGVFFPVKEEERIRYSFNISGGMNAWQPLGNKDNFIKVESRARLDRLRNVNRTQYLKDMQRSDEEADVMVKETMVKLYSMGNSTDGQPSFRHFSGTLRQNFDDVMLYTKRIEDGKTEFLSHLQRGPQKSQRFVSRYRLCNISLDFSSFDVEVSVKVSTTTWAEFLTDVFEYVGLFTGVCAYSLLVSPAKLYLQQVQRDDAQ